MTTIWCEECYCTKCVVGECTAEDVKMIMGYAGRAHCATYQCRPELDDTVYKDEYPMGDDHEW